MSDYVNGVVKDSVIRQIIDFCSQIKPTLIIYKNKPAKDLTEIELGQLFNEQIE